MGLGIVLEALYRPSYEPLQRSLEDFYYKTVFLFPWLRLSELQAMMFDSKYIQFKPKRAVVTLCEKIKKSVDPSYVQATSTEKSEFGAPDCPVRILRYHHRYISEHPELRKGKLRLFIPIKYNNAGKELCAATISKWICPTIVESHATM